MEKAVGLGLVFLSILGIAVALLKKGEPFFNLRQVISSHLQLFRTCRFQYVIFYFFPLLFAIGLSLLYKAGSAFFSELSIILGIILTMLLAMMSILCAYDFTSALDDGQFKRAKETVGNTINAIFFDCLLCIGLLLYDLTIIVLGGASLPTFLYSLKGIASGIAYYVFIVILLNLMLVIKQMSKLIEFSLETRKRK